MSECGIMPDQLGNLTARQQFLLAGDLTSVKDHINSLYPDDGPKLTKTTEDKEAFIQRMEQLKKNRKRHK